jgi:multidrug resistance efflux pump
VQKQQETSLAAIEIGEAAEISLTSGKGNFSASKELLS